MDNMEAYGNAEHGQKRKLIKQWVKHWTILWLNMYYAHSFSICYYIFIYLHPLRKSQKYYFLGYVVEGVQPLIDLLQEQNDISLTQLLHYSIRKSVWNYCVNCNDNNTATNWGKNIYSNFYDILLCTLSFRWWGLHKYL